MKHFVTYDKATGMIHRCGICPDGDFEIQANESEGVIEHERVNDTEYKVDLSTLEIIPIA